METFLTKQIVKKEPTLLSKQTLQAALLLFSVAKGNSDSNLQVAHEI